MMLFGYECPECGHVTERLRGIVVDGMIQVRCEACHFVEHIPPAPSDRPLGKVTHR